MGNLIRGPFTEPESEDDNGLDTGFRGRELWREGLSSKFKEDKMSKTPRTDAAELAEEGEDCVDYAVQHLANLARQLERELSAAQAKLEQAEARLAKYDELLYAVGNKYPNESRHETALRYIREREQMSIHISQTDAARRKEGA